MQRYSWVVNFFIGLWSFAVIQPTGGFFFRLSCLSQTPSQHFKKLMLVEINE